MKRYRVHLGTTPGTGRNKYAYFATLDAAQQFCNEVAARTRIILCIEEMA